MSDTHSTSRRHRLIAWSFVAAQVALIAVVILAPRNSQWETSAPLQLVGWSAMVGGLALGFWAARWLGRGLTPSPLPNGAVALVTGGPYRYVRHPMYTAVMLFVAGVAIRSGSWLVVGASIALGALFWAKSSWEERRLDESFPGYRSYRRQVPRFVPVPGRSSA